MSLGPDRRIPQDLLCRLCWKILGDLPMSKLHADLTRNRLTSLASPSLNRISAYSKDLELKEDLDSDYDEEDQYKSPANLDIHNEDGRPITLRQFMTEVHAYLNRLDIIEDIKSVKAMFLGHLVTREDETQGRDIIYGHLVKLDKDVAFFFARPLVFEREGAVNFRLSLFLDGETHMDPEGFWASRLKLAHLFVQERAV
ncbi:hypothetical protein EJ02DRAFT_433896 [Clathrospora elynae]|uniref:Uncharacterized protein n=1 Tax=Clathrospora elynae TaxID=706981 RepID=A0A6A5SSF5_9PLEO|nr:hypothetical protein EJ02DRAFT_433896 [Clathrospora elynae]